MLAIVAVLATMFFAVSGRLPMQAEGPRCMTNMRTLQVALNNYLNDVGHWPQEPEGAWENENVYEDWWLKELEPFGASPSTWQCPSIRRLVSSRNKDGRPKIHYTPTMFDANPATPRRWSTQPWLIEIGNMHGRGAHVCFPDGSIRAMNDILGE